MQRFLKSSLLAAQAAQEINAHTCCASGGPQAPEAIRFVAAHKALPNKTRDPAVGEPGVDAAATAATAPATAAGDGYYSAEHARRNMQHVRSSLQATMEAKHAARPPRCLQPPLSAGVRMCLRARLNSVLSCSANL
jgi:hypothetical protein